MENEYTCKVCGKSFENNEDLYIHYDYCHNQGNED